MLFFFYAILFLNDERILDYILILSVIIHRKEE